MCFFMFKEKFKLKPWFHGCIKLKLDVLWLNWEREENNNNNGILLFENPQMSMILR